MRGTVAGLATRLPMGVQLPGLLQDDALLQRMVSAFDEVLAPVIGVLDDLDAYVDPDVAPEDFVRWVGSWLGAERDDTWPLARRREAVRRASELHAVRGTPQGLADLLLLVTDDDVEVEDSGGVSTSTVAAVPVPMADRASVTVTIGPAVDLEAARAAAVAGAPAHVEVTVRRRPRRAGA